MAWPHVKPSMAPPSGQAIYGFYEPSSGENTIPIDKSPVRLPRVIGNDELEPYEHDPVNAELQIRLIELLPPKKASAGRNSMEQICCRIHLHDLVRAPEYEALSNTWGNMNRYLPISVSVVLDGDVDEEEEERALYATSQLLMALKRLRLRSSSRLLWIEQLCIYSYRTATKHLGTLRSAPQFFEGFDFSGKSGQAVFFGTFIGLIAQPVQFLPSFHVTSAPPILAPRSPF
jgi:hypothetical protein